VFLFVSKQAKKLSQSLDLQAYVELSLKQPDLRNSIGVGLLMKNAVRFVRAARGTA
jgi:hypothetical protein